MRFVAVFASGLLSSVLPIPFDPQPGQMDCLCAMGTWVVGSCTDADLPTITVSYSSDAHSGSCEGSGLDCPQLSACAGVVNMHVSPNAFTSFTDHPGQWGVNSYGTFDFTRVLTNCGQEHVQQVDVWSNPGGGLICSFTLWEFCTWCSDSTEFGG